jgi:predicted lipoprotein with Yx(FWY)xxD motif/predicted outer membrane protein
VEHRRSRTALVTAGGIAVLLLLAGACSPGAGNRDGDGIEDFPDVSAPPKSGKPILSVEESASLGDIVIDAKGRTLYRFDKDSATPSKSNCNDSCVRRWPPALAGDQLSTRGVEQNLVGKVKRRDGRWQLTLAGWPLYRFAGDRRAGDAKGQNFAGVWFAAAPDGTKAQTAKAPGSYDPNSGEDGATPTKWGPLTAADRDLLVKVREMGLAVGSVGRQAQRRARSRQVKAVGKQLTEQHRGLDAQVRTAAARLRVRLPSEPSADQQEWIDELSAESAADYDKFLVNRLRSAHGTVLTVAAQVRTGTRNSLVRALAQRAAGIVMAHMTMLEDTGLVDDLVLTQPSTSARSYSKP